MPHPTPKRRLTRSIARLLVGATLATLLAACSSNEPAMPDESLGPAPRQEVRVDIREDIARPLTPEQIARYQPDVRLAASFDGAVLTVRVLNRSGRALLVGPSNFGLIVGRKVHPFNSPDVQARFPEAMLQKDTAASGQFLLKGHGDLTGRYLAFDHPAVRPSRCRIAQPGAPQSATPRQPSQ